MKILKPGYRAAACIAALLLFAVQASAQPEPPGPPAYWDSLHQALMHMRAGRLDDALKALDEADRTTRGDGRILLSRGAVKTLTEDYAGARSDLERVRLEGTREPELWRNVVDCITNTASGGRGIPVPRSLQQPGQPAAAFSGVPGHLIAGGSDYGTAYASYLVYDMAWPYYLNKAEGRPLDGHLMQRIRRQAGRWFANRMLATRELCTRTAAAARRLFEAGDLREARDLIDLARSPYPFDAAMSELSGSIWLAAGRPGTAREDFTVALTTETGRGPAYLGRARAAALMGDGRRARADLAAARSLGVDGSAAGREIERLVAEHSAAGDPRELIAEMDALSAEGAPVEALVPLAMRVHRALEGGRLRYGEIYQDTLRRHEAVLREAPEDVGAMLDLAGYLLDEIDNRGEDVEPGRGRAAYRFQHSREMELSRADHYVRRALSLDEANVRGLVLRAAILYEMGRESAAAPVIERAAALAGAGDPNAVRLLAEFRRRQVGRMLMAAAGLRTPTFTTSSHLEHRHDGVYRVTTTTRYNPTAGDLARARELEAQARRIIAATKDLMAAAARASSGTLDGYILSAAYEDWFGSRDRALELHREAVARHPDSLKAHDGLTAYLRHLLRKDEALEAELAAFALVHTTAGPLLTRAWMNVDRGGFGPVVELLKRARSVDPADVRATLYLAEAKRQLDDLKQSAAYARVAAALETARLAFDDRGAAREWPRRAEDMASLMQSRIDLGRMGDRTGSDALAHYEEAIRLADRYPPDGVAALMFGAVTLAEGASRGPLPPTPNGARLAATALLEAGRRHRSRGSLDDAERCLVRAMNASRTGLAEARPGSGTARPNIGTGSRDDSNFAGDAGAPAAEACIELARIAISRGNDQRAFDLLQQATGGDLSREMRQQIQALMNEVIPRLRR